MSQHTSQATKARAAGGDVDSGGERRRRVRWLAFWVAAALLLVVALVLRLERIGEADLWLDEAFTWERATQMESAWETATCVTTHPPLTRLGVRLTSHLFGDSPAALRILPLLASLACLPLLGLVLWHAGLGRLTILVALALLALNPAAVDLANWVRHYSLAMALALWLTLVFLSLMRKPSAKQALHYGVVLALGVYTYYLFFLIPLAHALATLTSRKAAHETAGGADHTRGAQPAPPAPAGIRRLASQLLDGASRVVLVVPWFVDMLTRSEPADAQKATSRWFAPQMKQRVGALLLGGGLAFVLFLPWLLYLLSRWPHAETAHYAGHASTFEQMTHWVLTSFLGVRYREQGMMDWQSMLPAAYAGYYVAVIAVPLLLGALCLWRRRGAEVLAWLGFALPWMFLFTLGIWINMFGTFWHFSFTLPFVLALAAAGLAQPLRWGCAVVALGAPPQARLGGALACTAAAVAFVALLGSAVYGLSAQHGWGLLPEHEPERPSIGYDDEPMQRGPWRRVAAEIRREQQAEPTDAAVIAFPGYLKAALRYEIRDLPVLPYTRGANATQRLGNLRAPVVNDAGAFWPSLNERNADTLWIVAPTWKRNAKELAELMTHLHEQGYRVTLHAEVVALYREVDVWRATVR